MALMADNPLYDSAMDAINTTIASMKNIGDVTNADKLPVMAMLAQADATLALAREQRVANLIALISTNALNKRSAQPLLEHVADQLGMEIHG